MAENNSKPSPHAEHDSLAHASVDLVRHPVRNILRIWSWKTAAVSATLRAIIFLVTNRRAGLLPDLGAGAVEALFAIFASGLLGAITQRFRDTRPLWATALTVWLIMPALMTAAQLEVHRWGHTPHMKTGLLASFIFAAIASGFTWFSMRRGALLVAEGVDDSIGHDLRVLPRIIMEFALWPWLRSKPVV